MLDLEKTGKFKLFRENHFSEKRKVQLNNFVIFFGKGPLEGTGGNFLKIREQRQK